MGVHLADERILARHLRIVSFVLSAPRIGKVICRDTCDRRHWDEMRKINWYRFDQCHCATQIPCCFSQVYPEEPVVPLPRCNLILRDHEYYSYSCEDSVNELKERRTDIRSLSISSIWCWSKNQMRLPWTRCRVEQRLTCSIACSLLSADVLDTNYFTLLSTHGAYYKQNILRYFH